MIVTTADDVDLWWEREGDGPAVLLFPGRGDASDLFPHEFEVGESDRVGALVQAMGKTTESDRVWAAALVESGDRRAAYRPDAVDRHQAAAFRFDWPTIDALAGVRAPTLVVHGRQDRILPVAHAEALHAVVEGSTLSIVDDMGHIPRLADWLTIAAAIVALDPATTEGQAPT
jgi:pimeloyl-ACP methyl ester carboxylesterase